MPSIKTLHPKLKNSFCPCSAPLKTGDDKKKNIRIPIIKKREKSISKKREKKKERGIKRTNNINEAYKLLLSDLYRIYLIFQYSLFRL